MRIRISNPPRPIVLPSRWTRSAALVHPMFTVSRSPIPGSPVPFSWIARRVKQPDHLHNPRSHTKQQQVWELAYSGESKVRIVESAREHFGGIDDVIEASVNGRTKSLPQPNRPPRRTSRSQPRCPQPPADDSGVAQPFRMSTRRRSSSRLSAISGSASRFAARRSASARCHVGNGKDSSDWPMSSQSSSTTRRFSAMGSFRRYSTSGCILPTRSLLEHLARTAAERTPPSRAAGHSCPSINQPSSPVKQAMLFGP